MQSSVLLVYQSGCRAEERRAWLLCGICSEILLGVGFPISRNGLRLLTS